MSEIGPLPVCIGCGSRPEDLREYRDAASEECMTPDDYVRKEEGTFNPENGHFTCTPCYVSMGCPASPTGWKAP